MEPDEGLNFEEGEVIYENYKVGEWVKLWKATAISIFAFSPGFYIFEIYAADGYPSLQWIADAFNWWDIPRQFQDGGGLDLEELRYCDDHDYMNVQYGVKRTVVRSSHTMYCTMLFAFVYMLDFNYATSMRYNKDKDLVFVTKPTKIWGESEHVYEVHHLEQMVPSAISALNDMSANHKNGILTIKDMSQNDSIKFYKDDKYWNSDLREEFMSETRSLWKDIHDDKSSGRIFRGKGAQIKGREREVALRIERELEAAIEKYGPVTLPSNLHMDDFYDKIERNANSIISKSAP